MTDRQHNAMLLLYQNGKALLPVRLGRSLVRHGWAREYMDFWRNVKFEITEAGHDLMRWLDKK